MWKNFVIVIGLFFGWGVFVSFSETNDSSSSLYYCVFLKYSPSGSARRLNRLSACLVSLTAWVSGLESTVEGTDS